MSALPTLQSVFNSDQIVVIQQFVENQFAIKFVSDNATMSGGTVTVTTNAALSTSKIQLTPKSGTFNGRLTYSIVDGVSFTITSSNGADAGDITYLIVNL